MYEGTLIHRNTTNVYTTFMGMKYLPIKVIGLLVVRLRFSQWCCWRFRSSWLLYCVIK